MSDSAGDDPSEPPRHEDGTINEAGTPGFSVDGTDSFAVPGPADGLPPLDEDGAAPTPWRRLLVTAGAAVILLAVVVIIGSGRGDNDAGALRGTSGTTVPDFTLPSPFSGDPTDTTSDSFDESSDESTLSTYDPYATYDTYDDSTDYGSDEYTMPTYDDSYDDSYSDDYYQPYVPPYRIPPSPTTAPRSSTSTSSSTSSSVAQSTTTTTTTTTTSTTAPSTTTTSSTSTSSTTSTTVPEQWTQPTNDLGVACPAALRVWSGQHSLLAAVGTKAWRSLDGGQQWTEVLGLGTPTAYADVADGAAWVGTADGVFALGAGAPERLGAVAKVTSLSASTDAGTTTLLAVSDGTLQRRVGDGDWQQLALPEGTTPGEVLAIDATQFLVGTPDGILRSADGTAPTLIPDTPGVAGTPLHAGTTVSWLRADHRGIALGIEDGAHWTKTTATGLGIAASATSLVLVPGEGLVTTGPGGLVISTDGGTRWDPFAPQPSNVPAGVARNAASPATVVWSARCGQGRNAILSLADG